MVAWCTKPGHGTRLIPANTLQGVQFIKTPDYVQIAGFIDQTKINILEGDFGGEMDPHGADLVRSLSVRVISFLTVARVFISAETPLVVFFTQTHGAPTRRSTTK